MEIKKMYFLKNKKVKRCGFSRPYPLQQIITYPIFFFQLFIISITLFSNQNILTIYILASFWISSIIVFILGLKITYGDPTDELVIKQNFGKNVLQLNDVKQYNFCEVCNCSVSKRSKHCGSCNRCTENFDHHCKWLNNCIGEKNYWEFILLLVLYQMLLCIQIILICIHFKKEYIYNVYIIVLQALQVVTILIDILGIFALLQLLIFHVYLKYNNLTTFEYILKNDQKNDKTQVFPDLTETHTQKQVIKRINEKYNMEQINSIQTPQVQETSLRFDNIKSIKEVSVCFNEETKV